MNDYQRRDILESIVLAIALLLLIISITSCQKATIMEADTYARTINGHRYIIADVDVGVSIIHDQSCPAPDSTHIQRVKIVPR